MKRILNITLVLILPIFVFQACLQDGGSKSLVQVEEPTDLVTLQKGFFKPLFSPDGNKVLFTDQSNNGLRLYDLEQNKLSVFTSSLDAGLEASFDQEGNKLFYLTHDFDDKKRMNSLFVLNLVDGTRDLLVDRVRNIKLVYSDAKSILFYENGKIREYDLSMNEFVEEIRDHTGVFSDANLNLSVYENGIAKIINPGGNGNYLWPSLSPDQNRVLYTISGKGSFTSKLDGSDVVDLGRLHAPKWSPDGSWVVGMDDYDDGQKFTKSDIILVSSDGKKRQNLTKSIETIALYPSFSPDASQVVFNDEKGTVFFLNIN